MESAQVESHHAAADAPDRQRSLLVAQLLLQASLPLGRLRPVEGVKGAPACRAPPLLVALAFKVHEGREQAAGGEAVLLRVRTLGRAWWAVLTAAQRKAFLFSNSGRLSALADLIGPYWGAPTWRAQVLHRHWY